MSKYIISAVLLILFLGLTCFPKSMSKTLRLNFSIRWARIIGTLGLLWVALELITHLDANNAHLPRFAGVLAVSIKHFLSGLIVGLLIGLEANRSVKLSQTLNSDEQRESKR